MHYIRTKEQTADFLTWQNFRYNQKLTQMEEQDVTDAENVKKVVLCLATLVNNLEKLSGWIKDKKSDAISMSCMISYLTGQLTILHTMEAWKLITNVYQLFKYHRQLWKYLPVGPGHDQGVYDEDGQTKDLHGTRILRSWRQIYLCKLTAIKYALWNMLGRLMPLCQWQKTTSIRPTCQILQINT